MMGRIKVDKKEVAAFCKRYRIRSFAFYGSVLREDFGPGSDVDVLVEFEPGAAPGLFSIARMERELTRLFEGHKIDLRTPEDLSRYFRDSVLNEAEVLYAQK